MNCYTFCEFFLANIGPGSETRKIEPLSNVELFYLTENGRTMFSFLYESNFIQIVLRAVKRKIKQVLRILFLGEFPAAMQRAARPHHPISSNHYLFVSISVLFSTWFLVYVNRFKLLRT